MNDEIKEIIKSIKSYENEDFCLIMLSQKQNKALLDYITNLQQENEQLQTEQNTYINTIKEVNKECNSLFNHLTKKDLNYKSRNEKAIEHLKIKQARLINEKNYVITDLDLDEIMQDLDSKGDSNE